MFIFGIIIGSVGSIGIMKLLQWVVDRSLIVQNFKSLPLYRQYNNERPYCYIEDKVGRSYKLKGMNVNGVTIEHKVWVSQKSFSWGRFIKMFPEHAHEVLMLGSATYANKYKSEQEFSKILNEVEKELG